MFFSVILILLIAIVFRKRKMDKTGQQKSDEIEYLSKNKKELILGLAWYVFYFMLSYISCAFQVDIINELSNWLFLVLFPLLIIAVFRKEKIIQALKESGLRHFDRKTVLRILLICAAYQGVIILVFGLGGFCFNITNILHISSKMSKLIVCIFGNIIIKIIKDTSFVSLHILRFPSDVPRGGKINIPKIFFCQK